MTRKEALRLRAIVEQAAQSLDDADKIYNLFNELVLTSQNLYKSECVE